MKNVLQETLCMDRILDKMIRKHNLMNEFCPSKAAQICEMINDMFSPKIQVCTIDYIKKRLDDIATYKQQLEYLKSIPVVEQRSDEWFELRKNIITASDFAQAFGEAKFGTQKQFFQKKCGFEETQFDSSLPPLKWGIMFEPVAARIYQNRFECELHDFGLIQHPRYNYFGASPDGITDYGIMVEIKCPYRRVITGEVPTQYFYQVQGQLDVCGLQECDYLECEFKCFEDKESFFASEIDTEHGIIIETSQGYNYSPIVYCVKDMEALSTWLKKEQDSRVIKTYYWKLSTLNIVRIYKNESFVKEKLEALGDIWNKVKEYQNNKSLYDNDIKKRVTAAKNQVKLTGYSFLDE